MRHWIRGLSLWLRVFVRTNITRFRVAKNKGLLVSGRPFLLSSARVAPHRGKACRKKSRENSRKGRMGKFAGALAELRLVNTNRWRTIRRCRSVSSNAHANLRKTAKKSANRSETLQMRKLCGEVGRSAAKCIGAAQVMRLALHKAARNHLRTA